METILGLLCLMCGVVCFLLCLFTVGGRQKLSFGDMAHGAVGVQDIVNTLNKVLRTQCVPVEIALHFLICLIALLHQDYFLFLFTIPLNGYTVSK